MRLSEHVAPDFHEVHRDIKEGKHTHYWLKGGRGSTKSSFAGLEIILGMMKDPNANAVALRKVKDTLHDSVYEHLCWAIEVLGVSQFWETKESPLTITYKATGQKILFRGALLDKDIKKIKSTKFKKGYCKFIWYEELDEFNGPEEIRNINQSLMRGGDKFVVLYSYNPPKSVNSWVNTDSKLTRSDRMVHHSTYLNVPKKWLGEQFIIEAEHLKLTKLKAYEHEYLGEVTGTGGEVFGNIKIRTIPDDEIKLFENTHRGLDFGYATDPLAYIAMNYDRKHRRLFIFYELYKSGLSNRAAHKIISEENKKNELIIADSAEPKSINELNQYDLRVAGAKKGPDSVEYGIKFLQDLEEIIIDDIRCPEAAREFMNYEFDKDANGNFKAGFPDRNNHTIDAARYGLNYEIIKHRDEKAEAAKKKNFKFEDPGPDPFGRGEVDSSYINFGGG